MFSSFGSVPKHLDISELTPMMVALIGFHIPERHEAEFPDFDDLLR